MAEHQTLTQRILAHFIEMANDLAEMAVSRKGAYNLLQKQWGGADYSRKSFTKTLNNLKKSGYIKFRNDNQSIVLTNKAKMKMVDQIAKNTPVDNKYHLVSFDIPETMKTQRDHFRRTIKKLGFVQIQQSLWVSNKDLGEMVELASYEYGVEKYIAYFVSISSNIEYFIEKKFNNK